MVSRGLRIGSVTQPVQKSRLIDGYGVGQGHAVDRSNNKSVMPTFRGRRKPEAGFGNFSIGYH